MRTALVKNRTEYLPSRPILSFDEQVKEVLDTDEDALLDKDTNVTKQERDLLQESMVSMSTNDDAVLKQAALDNVDEDGTPLNEEVDHTGEDLDVPGSEDDNVNEKISEED